MNKRIKELAEQAGMTNTLGCFWQCGDHDLKRFADLVAAAEREACAKLCDDIDVEYQGEDVLATWCAAAIRARVDK